MSPDRPVIGRVRLTQDSGPESVAALPCGGLSPFGGLTLDGHVAELERLSTCSPLGSIIEGSRVAVGTRLHLARLEVELNVWMFSATLKRPR